MADLSGGGRTNQTTSTFPSPGPSNCTIVPPAGCNGQGTVQNCDCVCNQGYATDYTNLLDPQWCVLQSTDGRPGTSPAPGSGGSGSGGSTPGGGGTGKTSMLNRTSWIVLSLFILFVLLGLCWGFARWRKGKSCCCCGGSSGSSSKKHRHKRKRRKSESRRSSTSSSSSGGSSQYTGHNGSSSRRSSSSRNDLLDRRGSSHSGRKKRKDKYSKDVALRPYKKGRSDRRYAQRDTAGPPWSGPAMPHSMSYGGWMPSSMGGKMPSSMGGWPGGAHPMQQPLPTPFRSGSGRVGAPQQQQQQQPGTIRVSRGGSVDDWALPHRSSGGWGGQDVRIDINFPPEAGQQ